MLVNGLEGMGQEMSDHSGIIDGTFVKCGRAWLITWEWTADHAKVEHKVAGILNYRYSSKSIERIVEQIYANSRFAFHEKLAYAKARTSTPYRVQHGVVELGQQAKEKLDLPSKLPFADEMIYGGHPWLWARVVRDLRAYVDCDGNEHLSWKQRRGSVLLEGGEVRSEWEECHVSC